MTKPLPDIIHLQETDSTNAHARRLAEAGGRGPTWIYADQQTAGRGRRQRQWISEKGNLYATFLCTLPVDAATAGQIGFVAALAVYDSALKFLEGRGHLQLKWPNDVLLDGKKLAGILGETVGQPGKNEMTLAVGIGVDLAHAPENTAYGAVALNEFAASPVSVNLFLEALQQNMAKWLRIWDHGRKFSSVRAAFEHNTMALNQSVSIHMDEAVHSGKFAGLSDKGELVLLRDDGTVKTFATGDVSLRMT